MSLRRLNHEQLMGLQGRFVPGGVYQSKDDFHLTLTAISESFFSMFGFTAEEIESRFYGNFIEMVYPPDRKCVLGQIREQRNKGIAIELEYRVLCKDKPYIWVLDRGNLVLDENGEEIFLCLLVDITERKQMEEDLRLSLERYQIITNQMTDVLFEWNITEDTLLFTKNWGEKFDYTPVTQQIRKQIPVSKNIHPEDILLLIKILQNILDGGEYNEAEVRIKSEKGMFRWHRLRISTQFDSEHCPVKAVGVIIDIEREKKREQTLLDMTQTDSLTGLLNKDTITRKVEDTLRSSTVDGVHALFILDVDYFKQVNDTYGHLAGDQLLVEVASAIRSYIRKTDFAGRIGGDEFMVFLPYVGSAENAVAKAETLTYQIGLLSPWRNMPSISCSIGIALSQDGDRDFYTLFQNADAALYERKKLGRNGYTLFTSDLVRNLEIDEEAVPSSDRTRPESEFQETDSFFSQYAFRALYAAQNIEYALDRLLGILGRGYDVSRVYIMEDSADGRSCSKTFEWCAPGVPSQMNGMQNLSYEKLGNYRGNFDKDGIFHCFDIQMTNPEVKSLLTLQGVRSMLQYAMMDEGKFVGFVGFDECREHRSWSKQQVGSYKLTADVISNFVVRLRQRQKLRK